MIDTGVAYIKSLSKIQEIEFIAHDTEINNFFNSSTCATGLINDLEIFIPLAGLIDLAAERTRLNKEILKLKAEISKIDNKINNPGFLAKAPAAVVIQEKNKAEELKNSIIKLEFQYANLDKLD